jgi:hypothetical protein
VSRSQIVIFTTSRMLAPQRSRAADRLRSVCSVCARMSPTPTTFASASIDA